MKPIPENELVVRAGLAARLADPRGSGLMFHGTAEPFEGSPKAVGIDGLLWFADNPLMAQAYIPEAGLSAYVSLPSEWRMKERVRPDRHSFWAEFAVATMKRPALAGVEYDAFGAAISWPISPSWPTYEDCVSAARGLGYSFIDGSEEIKFAGGGSNEVVRADWLQPGRVFVTAADGLRLLDKSSGEGDLTEKAHLDFASFRAAKDAGFDGVVIDDFAQSADCGNVGHRAIGLFPATVERLDFLSYPAVHRRMGGARTLGTPDFSAFAAAPSAPSLHAGAPAI